jgi:cytochrome c oxidase subunit 2
VESAPPVTPMAQQMFDLHSYIFWICVAIFILVFGVMFYSIFKHRKSVGHQAAQFHENTTVEIVWTVIPFLILLFMAWPATKTVLAMKDTSAPDLTIKITGYQWKWGYDYLQEGFGFYSNLATPLAQIENREPKGKNYSSRSTTRWSCRWTRRSASSSPPTTSSTPGGFPRSA